MSSTIGSLLIPTDGSDGAVTGAKVGIAVASKLGAEVHVISVVDLPADASEFDDQGLVSALESQARDDVERIATLTREFDDRLEITTTVSQGTPFQTIREYAHRREIDAIVMGTKGRTGLDRVLLGSVTENVLRTAHIPVLAVPPEADVPEIDEVGFRSLLLPTDGSPGAEIATTWAIALSDRLGATLHTVFSVDTSRYVSELDESKIIAAFEDRGERAIEGVQERATDAGINVASSIASGRPASVILEYVSERDIDLIVMGTHGRTGIGQWFLGSVTENVVRQADVPVFCVPVSAEEP